MIQSKNKIKIELNHNSKIYSFEIENFMKLRNLKNMIRKLYIADINHYKMIYENNDISNHDDTIINDIFKENNVIINILEKDELLCECGKRSVYICRKCKIIICTNCMNNSHQLHEIIEIGIKNYITLLENEIGNIEKNNNINELSTLKFSNMKKFVIEKIESIFNDCNYSKDKLNVNEILSKYNDVKRNLSDVSSKTNNSSDIIKSLLSYDKDLNNINISVREFKILSEMNKFFNELMYKIDNILNEAKENLNKIRQNLSNERISTLKEDIQKKSNVIHSKNVTIPSIKYVNTNKSVDIPTNKSVDMIDIIGEDIKINESHKNKIVSSLDLKNRRKSVMINNSIKPGNLRNEDNKKNNVINISNDVRNRRGSMMVNNIKPIFPNPLNDKTKKKLNVVKNNDSTDKLVDNYTFRSENEKQQRNEKYKIEGKVKDSSEDIREIDNNKSLFIININNEQTESYDSKNINNINIYVNQDKNNNELKNENYKNKDNINTNQSINLSEITPNDISYISDNSKNNESNKIHLLLSMKKDNDKSLDTTTKDLDDNKELINRTALEEKSVDSQINVKSKYSYVYRNIEKKLLLVKNKLNTENNISKIETEEKTNLNNTIVKQNIMCKSILEQNIKKFKNLEFSNKDRKIDLSKSEDRISEVVNTDYKEKDKTNIKALGDKFKKNLPFLSKFKSEENEIKVINTEEKNYKNSSSLSKADSIYKDSSDSNKNLIGEKYIVEIESNDKILNRNSFMASNSLVLDKIKQPNANRRITDVYYGNIPEHKITQEELAKIKGISSDALKSFSPVKKKKLSRSVISNLI